MSRLFWITGTILLLLSFLSADLVVTTTDTNPTIYPGDGYASVKAVMAFYVSGNTGETFTEIGVGNGGNVSFSLSGVTKVYIVRSNDNTSVMKTGDSAVGSTLYNDPTYATSSLISVNFASQAPNNWYFVVYDFSTDATVGGFAYAKLAGIKAASGVNVLSLDMSSHTIEVKSPGFTFENISSWTISNTIVPAIGLADVPVFRFALKVSNTATNISVVVATINIGNANGNFATSEGDQTKIQNVKLFVSSGSGGDFHGVDSETLLANIDCSSKNASTELVISIPESKRITLNSTDAYPKYFYVLYSFGSSMANNTSFGVALNGAKGLLVGGGEIKLTGTLPAGNITSTVKATNIRLVDAAANAEASGNIVVGGQKKIRMLDFNIYADEPIYGASLIVKNISGTFYSSSLIDKGINKVAVYRVAKTPPFTEELIGAVTAFDTGLVTRSTCVVSNLKFEAGNDYSYYVEYDVGIAADPVNPNGSKASCSIGGIYGGNAVAGGVFPNPVNENSALVNFSEAWMWVESVSVNTTEINPGDTFHVDVGVRNVKTSGAAVVMINRLCFPKFYAGSIDGADVSSEYIVSLPSPTYPPGQNPFVDGVNNGTTDLVTLHFTVQADPVNLKTQGNIIVDAQIGYINPLNPAHNYDVVFAKHSEGGVTVPAARERNNRTNFTTKVIRVTGVSGTARELPTYIASIQVNADKYAPQLKRFANNDLIKPNSEMYIQLTNSGKDIDLDSLTIKQDGKYLYRASDYTVSTPNGLIFIKSIGAKSGRLEIICYSNNVLLPVGVITYVMPGDDFYIQNLYAYPSPYDPGTGPCQIGFEASRDSDYTLTIYDASGDVIHTHEGTANFGYNRYEWNGEDLLKGKVGRGVYLICIVGKQGSNKYLARTKLGVK